MRKNEPHSLGKMLSLHETDHDSTNVLDEALADILLEQCFLMVFVCLFVFEEAGPTTFSPFLIFLQTSWIGCLHGAPTSWAYNNIALYISFGWSAVFLRPSLSAATLVKTSVQCGQHLTCILSSSCLSLNLVSFSAEVNVTGR